jgi:hypothetical protein
MSDDSEKLEELVDEVKSLRKEVAGLKKQSRVSRRTVGRSIRKRSQATLLGWPVYDIALGPDPTKGEFRGHAKGIFAVGDIATGLFALGGVALGGVAIGGLSIGLIGAAGGAAIGSFAAGGAAVGFVACGGAAVGLLAIGGGTLSYFTWSEIVARLPFLGR